MNLSPALSVITICLNDKTGLEKTILSVKEQTFRNYEHLVIDGGSTDGSVEIINKNADSLSYFISEKDNGRYHAMNKGITASKGHYLLFLNSGDYLTDQNVLEKLFAIKPHSAIEYGNVFFDDSYGSRSLYKQPEVLSLEYMMEGTVLHPGAFIKRELFLNLGLYNEDYIIASDYDFFLNAIIKHNVSSHYSNINISVFNTLGISNNDMYKETSMQERKKIQDQYIPPLIIEYYKKQEIFKNTFDSLLIAKGKKNKFIHFLLKVTNKIADIVA